MPIGGARAAAGSPRNAFTLRRSPDVVRVLREGRALRSRRVVVYVAPGPGEPRAACVAGRKVGGAVARNRARRVLRAAWRALRARVPAGRDLVLVAQPEISGAKADDLVEEIGQMLSRAGVAR